MIESIDDLIVFLKHFHRHLLADPSLPPEQIPDDLPEGLAKIYRELGGLIDLIDEYLEPLWLNGYYVFGEPSHNFYVSKNRDILVMDYGDIWVGSSQKLKDVTHKDIYFESLEGG
jgi:hypothetical protein